MRPGKIHAALLLCGLLSGPPVAAGEWELGLGVTRSEDVPVTWSGWAGWLGEPRELSGQWGWRSEALALGVGGRRQGARRYPAVALAGAGVRLEGKQFFLGGALAVGNATTPQLSSRYQFISTLGWRRGRASLVYRHISNGGTRNPNRGEDMLALSLRFGG